MSATREAVMPRLCPRSEHGDVQSLLDAPLRELYPGGTKWLARRLAEIPTAGRVTVVGAPGGLAAVAIESWKPAGRVKLSTFFVSPGSRGVGVGASLARALTERWLREGRDSAYVTVASHVAPDLTRLLAPCGFTPLAVVPGRYGPGRDEHVLVWAGTPARRRRLLAARAASGQVHPALRRPP